MTDIKSLFGTSLFTPTVVEHDLKGLEKVYLRAQAISRQYGFTMEDFLLLTDKFWNFHMENFITREAAASILVTIQYNLAAGAIAQAAREQEKFQPLLRKILNFDVSAQFLLTEADHGLDAKNLETTATWQEDGSFILNTPHPGAAKFMPPTMPLAGLPRVAVVFAKLLVEGENRGLRPFLMALGNGKEMCSGVSSKLVPPLAGTRPLDHALTSFDNVYLPPSALFGSLEQVKNHLENFLNIISRVGVGTLSLSLPAIPILKVSAYIFGRYSQRRTITESDGQKIPILTFRTQQIPLLRTLAHVAVMEKMAHWVIARFRNPKADPRVRHALGTITKAVFTHHSQQDIGQLIERCGAQGQFMHNQLVDFQHNLRWMSIAEGDTLALSIRLATELLLGRYSIPAATDPECPLAKHESGLIQEARQQLANIKGGHRSREYNNFILPRCRAIVEAIGHRMGYEAGRESGLPDDILSLYESSVMELDLSWYIENGYITRARHSEMESTALDSLLSRLDTLLEETRAAEYTSAPMVSQDNWTKFVDVLPVYSGNASFDLETVMDVKAEEPPKKAVDENSCSGSGGGWRQFITVQYWSNLFESSPTQPSEKNID